MPVDPQKPRKVLVIHGVQTGSDADLNQDKLINELIRSRLGNIPLRYECELFRYEDINDASLNKFKKLLGLIVSNPVGKVIGKAGIDLVGDVVISMSKNSAADSIRNGLKNRIIQIYDEGNPCYIVAHSLGSIYAFDVIKELLESGQYFNRNSRKTWPVQGLLTIGSPIGLGMFKTRARKTVANFGAGDKWFRWLNLWDRNDPVVSGKIFGESITQFQIAESYLSSNPEQGWVIRDIPVDTGKAWLMAHTAYWQSPVVGDKLVDMISS